MKVIDIFLKLAQFDISKYRHLFAIVYFLYKYSIKHFIFLNYIIEKSGYNFSVHSTLL